MGSRPNSAGASVPTDGSPVGYTSTPGGPSATGLFDDRSMLRIVSRELVVAFSGSRALLMQATHPVAFAGFFAHTASLEAPYERLSRTAQVMDLIAFGDADEARRVTAHVRAMHRRVRGVTREAVGPYPAGTPYAAGSPELLLWVLACLVDSAVVVFERCVRGLSDAEREGYWADQRIVGGLFGLAEDEMPADWAAFTAYMDEMLTGDRLWVTDQARELATRVVLHPPVPARMRPVLEGINALTVGTLPDELRRDLGLDWDPVRAALLDAAILQAKLVRPLLPESLRLSPGARGVPHGRPRSSPVTP